MITRLVLLLAMLTACSSQKKLRQPKAGSPHIEVMTYNVNYGLAGDDETLAAIEHAKSDIVFLQETTENWERVIRKQLSMSYPHMAFKHCCLAGGLAVLSKYPFRKVAYIQPVAPGWFPAWIVEVNTPIGKLQVLNVHLRPPVSEGGSVISGYFSTPPIRKLEIERFRQYLNARLPTLIVGDFNEGAGGRAIVYLERNGFQTGLSQFDTPQDTWGWNTSVGRVSTQLDHMVYGPQLEPFSVRVVPLGRSDHKPVVGVFGLANVEHDAVNGTR